MLASGPLEIAFSQQIPRALEGEKHVLFPPVAWRERPKTASVPPPFAVRLWLQELQTVSKSVIRCK
jgi:hypothetical protein